MPPYPPLPKDRRDLLARELALVPGRFREDAFQEAWLAHLEGRDPIAAVRTFKTRERTYERRQVILSQVKNDAFPFGGGLEDGQVKRIAQGAGRVK